MKNHSIIILDRDGVLNKLLFNSITRLTDSPMSIEEVEIFPWISILNTLTNFDLAVATNQPAAAKGKISKENLIKINDYVISHVKSFGVSLLDVQICFHRSQDDCECRKPKTKMLENIFSLGDFDKSTSWMVGDRATDIMAGNEFGINTALLGPSVRRDLILLDQLHLTPTYHGTDLRDFVEFINKNSSDILPPGELNEKI